MLFIRGAIAIGRSVVILIGSAFACGSRIRNSERFTPHGYDRAEKLEYTRPSLYEGLLFNFRCRSRLINRESIVFSLAHVGLCQATWEKWWAFRDLNPGPADYESDALTN